MDIKKLTIAILLLLLVCSCSVNSNSEDVNTSDEFNVIAITDYVSLKGFLKFQAADFIAPSNLEAAIPVATKLISTAERKYYLTQSVTNMETVLIAMDNDFSPLGYVVPEVSGAPLSVKSITDFYIKNDTVVLYDFQTQKLLFMDQDLKKIGEQRLPYYLHSVSLSQDLGVVGYSGKMGQTLNDSTSHYDLLIFDDKYRLKEAVRTFNPQKYQGTVLHAFKPLLVSDAGLLYSEYLNDTVYELSSGISAKYVFQYPDELSLPSYVATLSHAELLVKLRNNELGEYQKAASPIFESREHLIFSFGDRNVLRYGVYDRKNKNTLIFDDYKLSGGEKLLKALYKDDDENYVSVIYPFELISLIDEEIIKKKELDEQFLDRLYAESLDGTPIIIRYKLKN